MRRTVGKALVAGAAAVMVTALAAPASATVGFDAVYGGCYYVQAPSSPVTQGENVGVLGVFALMVTPANTPDGGGEIDCKIQVNGVDAPGTEIAVHANGAGVVSGQQQITFDDEGGTLPAAECENDISADGSTSGWYCKPLTSLPQPPQVGDADTAYCPYGSITGTGSWTPAETATLAPHVFAWDTNANCLGAGDDSGAYHIVFSGSSNDACTAGTGSGTLSGSGPEGPIAGSFTFYRGGIHLYISGTFLSGGEQHNLQYWLDVLASTNGVCSYSTAPLIGHGAIVDSLST